MHNVTQPRFAEIERAVLERLETMADTDNVRPSDLPEGNQALAAHVIRGLIDEGMVVGDVDNEVPGGDRSFVPDHVIHLPLRSALLRLEELREKEAQGQLRELPWRASRFLMAGVAAGSANALGEAFIRWLSGAP